MALERLSENLRDMAKRAGDLRPAGRAVHEEMLSWQRTVQIGDEQNLGASLQNPLDIEHVWETQPNRFVFGTRVPYSVFHAEWREKNGMRSHISLPDSVLTSIAQKLARYIVTGRPQ